MAIWCLNTNSIGAERLNYSINNRHYVLNIYNSIFHENKNITQQKGLFTYIEDVKFDNELESNLHTHMFSFNEKFTIDLDEIDISKVFEHAEVDKSYEMMGMGKKTRNMLFKITISRKHYKFLIKKLQNRFINHHSLFPDYQGGISLHTSLS